MKKRALCFILIFIMALSMMHPIALAETNVITVQAETYLEGKQYASGSSVIPAYGSSPRYLGYNLNDWMTYKITAPQSGVYTMKANIASPSGKPSIAVIEGKEGNAMVCEGLVTISGSWTQFVMSEIGAFHLSAGENIIKLLNTGGGMFFDYLTLEKTGDYDSLLYDKTLYAEKYEACYDPTTTTVSIATYGGNSFVSFNPPEWIEYDVLILQPGFYNVSTKAAATSAATVSVSENNAELCRGQTQAGSSYYDFIKTKIGMVYLDVGLHRLRVTNIQGGFHFDYLILEKTVLSEQIEAENFNSGYLSVLNQSQGTGSVMSISELGWLTFSFGAEYSGYYKITINASNTVQTYVNFTLDGVPLARAQAKMTGSSSVYGETICYVNLKEGAHTIKIGVSKGTLKLDYLLLRAVPLMTDSVCNDFVSAVNNANTEEQIYDTLKSHESIFDIDIDTATEGIFYKTPLFLRLKQRSFESAEQIIKAFYESADTEKITPQAAIYQDRISLSNLVSGNVDLYVRATKLHQPVTVIAAIYKANQLQYLFTKNYIGGDYLTLSLTNLVIDNPSLYQFKMLYVDNFNKIIPYDANANLYREIYVSPNGDDSSSGDAGHPYRTLARAKQEIAAVNSKMSGDIIVNLASGYYSISETEVFNTAHSGKNGYSVIIRGEDALNPPVLSGGRKITGWTQAQNGVWKAPLAGLDEVRNLYINGYAAVRARSQYTYQVVSDYQDGDPAYAVDGITVSPERFPYQFGRPDDLELVWELAWEAQRTPVKNIITNADSIILQMEQPCFSVNSGTPLTTITAGKYFYLENGMELLDQAGEFYYNKAEGMIYYIPFPNENLNACDTYVGETEFLFRVEGNSATDKIKNIVFENLDIRYGAWNDVSKYGFCGIQADQIKDTQTGSSSNKMLPAQFAVKNADTVSIKNCRFSNLGSSAISMVDGVSNAKIEGNVIRDLSGSAIVVGTWEHLPLATTVQMCRNIDVKNNVIRRVAQEYRGCTAISVYYENSVNICHNDIEDLPYTGISAGWGWGTDVYTCGNINICHNRIVDVMNNLMDGSHIYTLGPMRDSAIGYNYTEDSKYILSGIYTDSGSAYLNVHHNVINESDLNSIWWYQGHYNTHDLYAHENFTTLSAVTKNGVGNIEENTTLITAGSFPVNVQEIISGAGVETGFTHRLNNLSLPAWRQSIVKTSPKTPYVNGYLLQAEEYQNCYDPTTGTVTVVGSGKSAYVSFNPPEWMQYEVNVSKAGTYTLTANAAMAWESGATATIAILQNEVETARGTIQPSDSWSIFRPNVIGQIHLNQGTNTIKIKNIIGGFHFDYFTLELN